MIFKKHTCSPRDVNCKDAEIPDHGKFRKAERSYTEALREQVYGATEMCLSMQGQDLALAYMYVLRPCPRTGCPDFGWKVESRMQNVGEGMQRRGGGCDVTRCDRTECDKAESGNLGKDKEKGIQGQGQNQGGGVTE